jgi:hypothetical protein
MALDLPPRRSNAEDMANREVDGRSSRGLITLGRVDVVRIQVGYRARPDGLTYQHFLLDYPVPEAYTAGDQDVFDERQVLAALEPVLYAGAATPQHYSVHQHRWHTTWGASPGAVEIGLLVTAGTRAAAVSVAAREGVVAAFRELLGAADRPALTRTDRDAAILRARRGAVTAYRLEPDGLSLSAEDHDRAEKSWRVTLRSAGGDEYDVVVGFVDGYAGSVWVRHARSMEVFDSIGSE